MLLLPPHLRGELEVLASAQYPFEACGLLIGRRAGARTEVVELASAANLERARPRERYTIDPVDQLAAERRALALGLAVVGAWHSHPDRPARPSEADRAGALEQYSYTIVSTSASGARELRSFRRTGGSFVEEAIVP